MFLMNLMIPIWLYIVLYKYWVLYNFAKKIKIISFGSSFICVFFSDGEST